MYKFSRRIGLGGGASLAGKTLAAGKVVSKLTADELKADARNAFEVAQEVAEAARSAAGKIEGKVVAASEMGGQGTAKAKYLDGVDQLPYSPVQPTLAQ
jgi:hypothetical protein